MACRFCLSQRKQKKKETFPSSAPASVEWFSPVHKILMSHRFSLVHNVLMLMLMSRWFSLVHNVLMLMLMLMSRWFSLEHKVINACASVTSENPP